MCFGVVIRYVGSFFDICFMMMFVGKMVVFVDKVCGGYYMLLVVV